MIYIQTLKYSGIIILGRVMASSTLIVEFLFATYIV
jgi:hypothetical protein